MNLPLEREPRRIAITRGTQLGTAVVSAIESHTAAASVVHRLRVAQTFVWVGIIPFVVLVAVHWSTLPLLEMGDYAQYLLHAEALLHGHSYVDIGYIFTPYAAYVGPRAQPPGLPLTLVPILAVFGRNWAVMKLLMVASGIVFLVVSGRDLERRSDRFLATGAVMMTAVALEFGYATNTVLSDLGFCALVWGLIFVADATGVWTARRALAIGLLGLGAISYRVAGVALVPAMLLFAVINLRRNGTPPFAVAAVWITVGLGAVWAAGISTPFTRMLPMQPQLMVAQVVSNARQSYPALMESHLYPLPWVRANYVYHVVAALLTILGGIEFVRTQARTFLVSFVAVYVVMLALAPVADTRYWWVLYPLFSFAFLNGCGVVVRRLSRGPATANARPLFYAALVLSVAGCVGIVRQPRPASLVGNGDAQNLFAAVRERESASPMRVYFTNPRVLTWETGAAAMPMFDVNADKLLNELTSYRITHVVVGQVGAEDAASHTLRSTVTTHPQIFLEEYRNPTFVLYRFAGGDARSVPAAIPAAGHHATEIPDRNDPRRVAH